MADKGTVIKILLIECSLYTAGTHMFRFYIVKLIERTKGISSFTTYMQLKYQYQDLNELSSKCLNTTT